MTPTRAGEKSEREMNGIISETLASIIKYLSINLGLAKVYYGFFSVCVS